MAADRVRRASISQGGRLLLSLVYILGFLVLAPLATKTALPPFGIKGLWFYSAVAGLVLGEFLLEPFFTRPADALANATTLLIAASSVSLQGAEMSSRAVRAGRIAFIVYAIAVLFVGALAVLFKDGGGAKGSIARAAYVVVGVSGRARWLFGALYFAVVYAAFAKHSGVVALLYLAWIVVFSLHPLEHLARRLGDRRPPGLLIASGRITGVEEPGVVKAVLPSHWRARLGQTATVKSEDSQEGTIVDATKISIEPVIRISLANPSQVRLGDAVELGDHVDESVIGHVSERSQIDDLSVVTTPEASKSGLEEGRLLQTRIGASTVLFQITGAQLEMRSDEHVDRDLVRIAARKLGVWDAEKHGFQPVPWVPDAGAPVEVFASRDAPAFEPENIGHLPGTDYGVKLDLDAAITHNTAILGILGIGKTHLAWEIIKRLLLDESKVVALDITGKYAPQFEPITPDAFLQGLENRVEQAIAPSRHDTAVVDNEAGNAAVFRDAIQRELENFYASDCRLLIINPLHFDVTKMEGRPTFQGAAVTLSRLTMVEITRVIAEALLQIMIRADEEDPNTAEKARLCLVLEEAHSTVPEWNAATGDAEKWAVNGTARAILQGRKYGYGCLLITQRTASVTKSILNQCNTIFALRAYDATGAGFLEHYVGPTYAPLLASLKERQAVLFGRASSCAAPMIMEVNDADTFDQQVWQPRIEEIPPCEAPEHAAVEQQAEDPAPEEPPADDIPF